MSKLAGTGILPSILSSWDQAGSEPTGEKIAGAMYNGILDFDANIRASYPHVSFRLFEHLFLVQSLRLRAASIRAPYPYPSLVDANPPPPPFTFFKPGVFIVSSARCNFALLAAGCWLLAADWV